MRKGPVGLEVTAHGLDRQPLEHGREHRAGHPVRRVDHHAERPDRVQVHEREDALDEGRPDVDLPDMSKGLTLGPVETA